MYKPTRVLVHPFTNRFYHPCISPPADTLWKKFSQWGFTWIKLILLFFEISLTLFDFCQYTTFLNLYPIQKSKNSSLWCTSMFLFIFYQQWKRLLLWHQSMNCYSHSIRDMSRKFHSLIGFLWVNWNSIFTVLVFWLSHAFKFFT